MSEFAFIFKSAAKVVEIMAREVWLVIAAVVGVVFKILYDRFNT